MFTVICMCLWLLLGDSRADSIEPVLTHKVENEGDDVTLSCKYKPTTSTGNYLHWYKQHPKSNPKFLLYIYDTTGGKSDLIPPCLDVKVDKTNKQVNLIISSAAVSDSDLYYCALAPTVTGNPAALYKNLHPVMKETDTVTLKCSYETSSEIIYLYWYKQNPNSTPEFILYKGARSKSDSNTPTDTRLESKTTRDSTELTIRGLKISDSALYNCTLKVLRSGVDSTPDDHRLESETYRDSTKLIIRGLKLSDSALYHCALQVVAQ
ncbi:hypothetical protein C0J50_12534 [Silurus asotus]|uniref:Ig-like domain-containing protein n=1 Tax=Silurus asotus TaxID=30991 RepID=A0AAD4ZYZ6_SILAS|nr:hypothetical protein C0J50_12534 [Silurus asotus]